MDWKEQAEALFFVDHLRINDIAAIVKKSRETVSRYICQCDGYECEMKFRKELSLKKLKDYKRDWDRDNRSGRSGVINAASMKQEHILATKILSQERFF